MRANVLIAQLLSLLLALLSGVATSARPDLVQEAPSSEAEEPCFVPCETPADCPSNCNVCRDYCTTVEHAEALDAATRALSCDVASGKNACPDITKFRSDAVSQHLDLSRLEGLW